MKRIYSYIIYITCLTAVLLAGCESKYPYIEYEGNPGKVEFDNFESLMPIRIAIDDPLYESHTRGTGASDKDMDSIGDIRIYAFYTPTEIHNEPDCADYSKRMSSEEDENIYCLVDDSNNENIGHGKKAHLYRGVSPFLKWTDFDEVYYSNIHPQARYQFFAYHVDDATDMTKSPNRYADYVAYEINIDGTQDLMYSYAQPTSEQLSQIKDLTNPSNKTFFNNIDKLTYSTESALRDLIPTFKMEHQLAYVKFFLKAEKVGGVDTLDAEVEKVRVKNIIIKNVPFKGEFIVAAEDTDRLGIAFTSDSTHYYMPMKNIDGSVVPGNSNGFTPLTPDTIGCWVGAGILLPPAMKYTLEMDCYIEEGEGKDNSGYNQEFHLSLTEGFKAGHQYEVTIKVYGPRNISFNYGSVEWKEGGDISIDEDFKE